MKIYLIDDDPNVSNILKIIIQAKQLGEICGIGYSTVDALDDLKYIKPDIIVVDLLMPDMDGIETTRQLRQMGGCGENELCIVALSANAVNGMEQQFLESGMNDFLAKPMNNDKLAEVLVKWLPKEMIHYIENSEKN